MSALSADALTRHRNEEAKWVVAQVRQQQKKVTQLVNVEEHVEGFRQVREAHRRELIDDYVELISDLIIEVGEARQVDMAARLGVSQPTVAKMLKRLASLGFIQMIPWRGVFSDAGRGEAGAGKPRAAPNCRKFFTGIRRKSGDRAS